MAFQNITKAARDNYRTAGRKTGAAYVPVRIWRTDRQHKVKPTGATEFTILRKPYLTIALNTHIMKDLGVRAGDYIRLDIDPEDGLGRICRTADSKDGYKLSQKSSASGATVSMAYNKEIMPILRHKEGLEVTGTVYEHLQDGVSIEDVENALKEASNE